MCLSKELDTIKIEFWNKVFVLYQSELPVQKKKKKKTFSNKFRFFKVFRPSSLFLTFPSFSAGTEIFLTDHLFLKDLLPV